MRRFAFDFKFNLSVLHIRLTGCSQLFGRRAQLLRILFRPAQHGVAAIGHDVDGVARFDRHNRAFPLIGRGHRDAVNALFRIADREP